MPPLTEVELSLKTQLEHSRASEKHYREQVVVRDSIIRLAVDLIPPAILAHTQAGAQLVAAIEKAGVPAVRL